MYDSSLPPRLQELAAGYALGNLDSDELQEFHQLAADYPEQSELVADMQELMNLLPFSLEPQAPPASIRDRILSEASNAAPNALDRPKAQKAPEERPWILLLSVLVAGTMGGFGIWSTHKLHMAQRTIKTQQQKIAQLQSPDAMQIKTSPQVLMANWNGISLVLEDHLQAQKKGTQAVEIQAETPPELFQRLQDENFSLPQPTPSLSLKNLDFLGGSLCKFGQTKGLRIMYETSQQHPISFYQLKRAETPNFPLALSEHVLIQSSSGPNMLLWGNDAFLFAIVGDLANPELEILASTLEAKAFDQLETQNL